MFKKIVAISLLLGVSYPAFSDQRLMWNESCPVNGIQGRDFTWISQTPATSLSDLPANATLIRTFHPSYYTFSRGPHAYLLAKITCIYTSGDKKVILEHEYTESEVSTWGMGGVEMYAKEDSSIFAWWWRDNPSNCPTTRDKSDDCHWGIYLNPDFQFPAP